MGKHPRIPLFVFGLPALIVPTVYLLLHLAFGVPLFSAGDRVTGIVAFTVTMIVPAFWVAAALVLQAHAEARTPILRACGVAAPETDRTYLLVFAGAPLATQLLLAVGMHATSPIVRTLAIEVAGALGVSGLVLCSLALWVCDRRELFWECTAKHHADVRPLLSLLLLTLLAPAAHWLLHVTAGVPMALPHGVWSAFTAFITPACVFVVLLCTIELFASISTGTTLFGRSYRIVKGLLLLTVLPQAAFRLVMSSLDYAHWAPAARLAAFEAGILLMLASVYALFVHVRARLVCHGLNLTKE